MSIPNKRVEELIGFLNEMGSSIIWQESGETGDILEALRELIDSRARNDWVKCSERLPELEKIVEVIVPANECVWVSHALRYLDDGEWLWSFVTEDHICLDDRHTPDTEDAEWVPTHWRPLPTVPPAAPSCGDATAVAAARNTEEKSLARERGDTQ